MIDKYTLKRSATAVCVTFITSISLPVLVNAETAGLSSRSDAMKLNSEAVEAPETAGLSSRGSVMQINEEGVETPATAGLSSRGGALQLNKEAMETPEIAGLSGRDSIMQLNNEAYRLQQAEIDGEIDKLRESVVIDAIEAVDETRNALALLTKDQPTEALAAINKAIGKIEETLKREPSLGLKSIYVEKTVHDIQADKDAILSVIEAAKKHLNNGRIQHARMKLSPLASDITISTTSIPLGSYPESLKAIPPLIDSGNIPGAKIALQRLLGTLVTKEYVIPLPPLRAEALLQEAETLAENEMRSEEETNTLQALLAQAHDELEMSEVLGYGNKTDFQAMHEMIYSIEKIISDNKGGMDLFDGIKLHWENLFS